MKCTGEHTEEIEKTDETSDLNCSTEEQQKPGAKKRGRKPKGGKIIQQVINLNNNKVPHFVIYLRHFDEQF